MPKAVPILSPFHNLPVGDLADHLGDVKARIADLEAREKSLRDELLRRGVAGCQGKRFSATIASEVRWTLNTAAVKAEMGADWWNARCRQSMVTKVCVNPIAVVAAVPAQVAA